MELYTSSLYTSGVRVRVLVVVSVWGVGFVAVGRVGLRLKFQCFGSGPLGFGSVSILRLLSSLSEMSDKIRSCNG